MRALRQYVELEITLPKSEHRIMVTALVARIIDGLEVEPGKIAHGHGHGHGLGLDFFLFDARAKNEWHRFIREVRAERAGASRRGSVTISGGHPGASSLDRNRRT